MFDFIILFSFIVLILCLLMLSWRFIMGPTNLDRLMVMEAITLLVLCLAAVWGLVIDSSYFFDGILVLSIVGFIGTVAVAKLIEKGNLFDD
jgi:multicomponent Na+:H+ antiporter subunit F